MNIGPQRNKLQINRKIKTTGIVQELDIANNDVVRFVVENANAGNTFIIRMKLKGQLGWDNVGTLTGNVNQTLKSDVYDFMQIECTVLDGTNVKLLASGFIDG